jgi:tetratricopeptide (TPR) repeat protein
LLRPFALAPQIPEGHEALGTVLVELGKPADAIPELQTALSLKPGDPGFETNLALAFAKADQPANAIPHFSAAYQISLQAGQQPVDAAFCEAYARALAAVGNQSEAIEMFRSRSLNEAATVRISSTPSDRSMRSRANGPKRKANSSTPSSLMAPLCPPASISASFSANCITSTLRWPLCRQR